MSVVPSEPLPDRRYFVGIFTLALTALSYQILLTRIFSATLYYHFAFAGISLAMLGLTLGAERVFLQSERFGPARMASEWAKAAIGFAVSSVAVVLWFLYAPLVLPDSLVRTVLALSLILFVVPFTYSGICITLILTRSGGKVGALYAADLVGAALGCIGIVAGLLVVDPVSLIFALAAMSALAGWFMVGRSPSRLRTGAAAVAVVLVAAAVAQGAAYRLDAPHLGISWAKGTRETATRFERWNAISRVRVDTDPDPQPLGGGFAHPPAGPVEQLRVYIDADAETVITHPQADLQNLGFLADDVINSGYLVRPPHSVAVIGVGGGRDILAARYFGADRILGIELNRSILEALEGPFADFSGRLAESPGVHLVNAEARSWLNQQHPSLDLVQISMVDTWAATAAGGLTLSENRLYTLDAWTEFLQHLDDHGVLAVSRWFDADQHVGEFYRLLSLAAGALERVGVPQAEVRQHILAVTGGAVVTVVTSRSAYSDDEIRRFREAADARGFTILLAPDHAWDETSRTIGSGAADAAFYAALPIDVTAPTDDRPFFFYITRWRDLLSDTGGLAKTMNYKNNTAILTVCGLLVSTLFCMVMFVLGSLPALARHVPPRAAMPQLCYFVLIGIAFMLIEIAQMQRLIVFLGHPVFGLSVVLFTLLLFGGIGSMTVGRESPQRPSLAAPRPALRGPVCDRSCNRRPDRTAEGRRDDHQGLRVGRNPGAQRLLHGHDVPGRHAAKCAVRGDSTLAVGLEWRQLRIRLGSRHGDLDPGRHRGGILERRRLLRLVRPARDLAGAPIGAGGRVLDRACRKPPSLTLPRFTGEGTGKPSPARGGGLGGGLSAASGLTPASGSWC